MIDPFNPANVLIGTIQGIARSTDAGLTWNWSQMFDSFPIGFKRIVADPKNPGVFYAAMQPNLVAKSTDGGAHWTIILHGFLGMYENDVTTLEIDPVNTSALYVGAYNGVVYKSTDGGASFPVEIQPAGTLAGYATAILVDPASPSTVYVSLAGSGVYKSSDGGATWKSASSLTNPDVDSIATALDGAGVVYLGTAPVSHAFVAKLDSSGAKLVYATYIGGESTDVATSLAIDSLFNCCITGYTSSKAFPQTIAFQPTINGGSNAFLSKLDQSGSSLVYSTYFGGGAYDAAHAIAVDTAGTTTIAGQTGSDNLYVVSPLQPSYAGLTDAFIAQFDPAGVLRYSTYLGGKWTDSINSVAVDPSGSIYVTGLTGSDDFPLTPGAVHTGSTLSGAVFVTKINNDPSKLEVTAAKIDGKNLLVYGQNFARGAVILLNGHRQRQGTTP